MPGFVVCERSTGRIVGFSRTLPTVDETRHVVVGNHEEPPDFATRLWDGAKGLRDATREEVDANRKLKKNALRKQLKKMLKDQAAGTGTPLGLLLVACVEAVRKQTLVAGLSQQQALQVLTKEAELLVK